MAKKSAVLDNIPPSLKQKMAQSVTGTAPSLVPPPYTPKPKVTEDEPVPTIDDLIGEADDKQAIRELIARQVPLNAQKKILEKQIEPLNDRIKKLLAPYGVDKMLCDGTTVTLSTTIRRTIDPMKLLAAGIEQELIDACTDSTVSKMLVIREAK